MLLNKSMESCTQYHSSNMIIQDPWVLLESARGFELVKNTITFNSPSILLVESDRLSYVSQSGRSHKCRLKEHQHAVRNGDVPASAIVEHEWGSDHRIDWEKEHTLNSSRYLNYGTSTYLLTQWTARPNEERGPLLRYIVFFCLYNVIFCLYILIRYLSPFVLVSITSHCHYGGYDVCNG